MVSLDKSGFCEGQQEAVMRILCGKFGYSGFREGQQEAAIRILW